MKLMDKLERKFGRYGIRNIMMHISIVTGLVFVMQYLFKYDIVSMIVLNRTAVFEWQLWRLVTFIFVPPSDSILWILLTLYFYYWIGSSLEDTWGYFRFNVYYLLCMLGTIAAALIFGGTYDGFFVNLSMFLAFAYLYPNQEVMLFFIIPVKIKWLAWVDIAFLVFSFVAGTLSVKLSIIASLTGLIVFFGGDIYRDIRAFIRRQNYKRKLK